MSWGFFADLRLTLSTAGWARLRELKPADVPLAEGWSGLEDRELERSFGRPATKDETFGDVLAREWHDAVARVDAEGDRTNIRVCALLDKSELELAHPLATLLEAARG